MMINSNSNSHTNILSLPPLSLSLSIIYPLSFTNTHIHTLGLYMGGGIEEMRELCRFLLVGTAFPEWLISWNIQRHHRHRPIAKMSHPSPLLTIRFSRILQPSLLDSSYNKSRHAPNVHANSVCVCTICIHIILKVNVEYKMIPSIYSRIIMRKNQC